MRVGRLRVVPLVALAAAAWQARARAGDAESAAAKCPQVIAPENAQALFAALKDFRGEDGCALEEVRTEGDVMRVEWKKSGAAAASIEVRPIACGRGTTANGPAFAMSAPASAAAQCPAAIARMTSIIAGETLGGTVLAQSTSTAARARARLAMLAGAGAVVLAIAAFVSLRRRRRTMRGSLM